MCFLFCSSKFNQTKQANSNQIQIYLRYLKSNTRKDVSREFKFYLNNHASWSPIIYWWFVNRSKKGFFQSTFSFLHGLFFYKFVFYITIKIVTNCLLIIFILAVNEENDLDLSALTSEPACETISPVFLPIVSIPILTTAHRDREDLLLSAFQTSIKLLIIRLGAKNSLFLVCKGCGQNTTKISIAYKVDLSRKI